MAEPFFVHRYQLTLFPPSVEERERHRLYVLEGHAGIPAREEMVRGPHARQIVQPTPEPRRPSATPPAPRRPVPATPTQRQQRRMLVLGKPPKRFGAMSDAEIDDFAAQVVRGMAEQRTREAPTGREGQRNTK
jgi:hypothetical protein